MVQRDAPRSLFEEAIGLVDRGDTLAAENLCRETLERFPRDASILGLLGAVLLRLQRYPEAEQLLRQTVDVAPSFAKPWEDLGTLLLERNRVDEALECLQRAVHLDPRLDLAHFNLGKALAQLGRGAEADLAFEASFELAPQRKALAHAALALREGRVEEAERCFRRVLLADPRNVDALRMLAMIALEAGKAADAERLLRRALALAPDYQVALIDLGRLLKDQDRFEEAIGCFRQALHLNPDNVQGHFLLAATLAPAAFTEQAAAAYRRCIELQPRHAPAWLGLGHVLKTLGEYTEGVAAYRRCIELKPDNGETWWSLANLKTLRFDDADIQHMRIRARAEETEDQSRVNFLFALAKADEDGGNFDGAWTQYCEGNRRMRALQSYDPVHIEVMNDAIIEVFDEALFSRCRGFGDPDRAPIFVLGLPRSGSTLIEQILASHSQVEGTAELPYIGRLANSLNLNRADGINYPHAVRELDARHLHALGEQYIESARIHRHQGRRFFIDKMPNNFPNVGFIHLCLPNARIIDARRAPLDACVANFRQLYAKGQAFTYDLTEIGEYYLQYRRLMDHWD
ncbi:MAG: tetratricopeptide repeat protein, partial [Pseudomonadales bacterium]|nr:tetratricopeptide repeat protein [Pseudomonadales bacterium]